MLLFPIVVYTNLFTLKNKLVRHNKYIDLFYIWLNNIIKYGKLKETDYCILFIDEITLNYISKNTLYTILSSKIKNFHLVIYEQPNTIKEGILKRYDIEELLNITKDIEESNPQYIYLDIDVLVVNNIRKLFYNKEVNNKTVIDLTPDNRWNFLDDMFYGKLASDEDKEILSKKNINIPGFSAGIFGWCNSINIKEYFDFIKNLAIKTDIDFYTVEQPFFNAAIFNYFFKDIGKFQFYILDSNKITFNTFLSKNKIINSFNEIVLIDYCGEPGDDSFHWNKIFSQLIIQNLLF